MVIPYQTAKIKSANIFVGFIWDPTAKPNNVLIRIVATVTINFSFAGVQVLIKINTQLLQEFLIIPFMMHHYCPPPPP